MSILLAIFLGVFVAVNGVPTKIYGNVCEFGNCTYDCVNNNCSDTKIICLDTTSVCNIDCNENNCNGLYIFSAAHDTILNCDGNKACYNTITNNNDEQLHLYCGEYGIESESYVNNKNFNEDINSCNINCNGFQSCRHAYVYGRGNINEININSNNINDVSLYDITFTCELTNDNICLLNCFNNNCNPDAKFYCNSGRCSCIGNSCVTINTVNLNVINPEMNTDKKRLVTITIVSIILVIILSVVCFIIAKRLLQEHKSLEEEIKSMRSRSNIKNPPSMDGISSLNNTTIQVPNTLPYPTNTMGIIQQNIPTTNQDFKKYTINVTGPNINGATPLTQSVISPLSGLPKSNPFYNVKHMKKDASTDGNKSVLSFSGITSKSSATSNSSKTMQSSQSSASSSSVSSVSNNSSDTSATGATSNIDDNNNDETSGSDTDANLDEIEIKEAHIDKDSINKFGEGIDSEQTTLNVVWNEEDFKNIGSFKSLNKSMNKHAKEFIQMQIQQQHFLNRQHNSSKKSKSNNLSVTTIDNNDDASTAITTSTSTSNITSTTASSTSTDTTNTSLTSQTSGSTATTSSTSSNSTNTTSSASSSTSESQKLLNNLNNNINNDSDDDLHLMESVSNYDKNERRKDYDLL